MSKETNTDEMIDALRAAERYLVERGIENHGVEGRTMVLPAIRQALKNAAKQKCEHKEYRIHIKRNCYPYGDDVEFSTCVDCGERVKVHCLT